MTLRGQSAREGRCMAANVRMTPDGIPVPPPSLDDVLFREQDGIGWITLNRPVVLNAVDWSLRRRLMAALERAEADDAVKVVIMHGAGRSFCAGGDIQSTPPEDGQP